MNSKQGFVMGALWEKAVCKVTSESLLAALGTSEQACEEERRGTAEEQMSHRLLFASIQGREKNRFRFHKGRRALMNSRGA